MRRLLTDVLEKDGRIRVTGFARNGAEALEKIPRLKPQVVTMDVEMPGLDGLQLLQALMREFPVPVIMVSSLTTSGAEATIRALEMGAVDFVAKPPNPAALGGLAEELPPKVLAVAGAAVARTRARQAPPAEARPGREAAPPPARAFPRARPVAAVGIGTSTGGPSALYRLLGALPAGFPAGLVIVQHMPPGFTRPLAVRLNEHSALSVKEAAEGDVLRPGLALLAPAGSQMTLERRGGEVRVRLGTEAPFPTLFRPSVDVTLTSLAAACSAETLGVILTGMGNDGVRGLRAIKERQGHTLAEAESSCIVFGMPRAAIEAGVVDRVVPLEEMGEAITAAVAGNI